MAQFIHQTPQEPQFPPAQELQPLPPLMPLTAEQEEALEHDLDAIDFFDLGEL